MDGHNTEMSKLIASPKNIVRKHRCLKSWDNNVWRGRGRGSEGVLKDPAFGGCEEAVEDMGINQGILVRSRRRFLPADL